ncbi:winged helix-turn-helix transcriptional regulator [Anaerosporobacter sp.]
MQPCTPNMSIAIDLLSGKWSLKILICLCQAKKIRFNDLRRMLPGISNNMLAQCLREFEKYKIVERKQYEEIPPRVEYSLTELGQQLHPAVHLLSEWGHAVQEANGINCTEKS